MMCNCASCEQTDRLAGLPDLFGDLHVPYLSHGRTERAVPGFNAWPRGEPAGKRSSAKAYADHVAVSKGYDGDGEKLPDYYRKVPKGAVYPHDAGATPPITPAPKFVRDWINSRGPLWKSTGPALPGPDASPETPAKAPRHFPRRDRPQEASNDSPQSATIYAMAKSEKSKRSRRGRPALPGRMVVVKLEEAQINRAKKLGGGKVAAGIRAALKAG